MGGKGESGTRSTTGRSGTKRPRTAQSEIKPTGASGDKATERIPATSSPVDAAAAKEAANRRADTTAKATAPTLASAPTPAPAAPAKAPAKAATKAAAPAKATKAKAVTTKATAKPNSQKPTGEKPSTPAPPAPKQAATEAAPAKPAAKPAATSAAKPVAKPAAKPAAKAKLPAAPAAPRHRPQDLFDAGEANAIVTATHGDPFHFLGRHVIADGTVVVRAFLPQARSVQVIDAASGRAIAAMDQVHDDGLFVAALPAEGKKGVYRFRVETVKGDAEIEDPYRFGTVVADADLRKFVEGRHLKPYDLLGVRERTMDGVDGVVFAVWAPGARRPAPRGSRWWATSTTGTAVATPCAVVIRAAFGSCSCRVSSRARYTSTSFATRRARPNH